MKDDSIIKKVIYSSSFLAAVPAIVFMFLLHPTFSRYSLKAEPTDKSQGEFLYKDLNSDSISETIYIKKGNPYFFLTVKKSDLRFYDQWNLMDSLTPSISRPYFGDYDHDTQKEIYVFTYKGDSLFLNVNEILQPHGIRMDRIFITTIGYIKGEVTSSVYPAGFFDENNDGKDELYFGITSGYKADPRRVYYYDLVNRKLQSSQFTGIICLNPEMADVNGDKKPELFGEFSACGNFGMKVPFSDSSTWFMVFNSELKFEFPPVEFKGYVNDLMTKAYRNDSFRGYVLSHIPMGMDSTVLSPRIMIWSSDGKIVRYRLMSDLGLSGNIKLYTGKSDNNVRIYLYEENLVELNDKLEIIRSVTVPLSSPVNSYRTDINSDKEDEFLFYSEKDSKLLVYNNDLQKLAETNFTASGQDWKFSKYRTEDSITLFFDSGGSGYFLKLTRNKLYFLGYLVYPGIYFLFYLFIIVIKRVNTLQVVERESLNRRLVTLQLQAIKSQLDPHFTFNTLNSIASLIYLEDRELAYDFMNKFTQLLRGLINDAEMVYRTLGKELEFVTTYLELEKLRYGEKFNFEISIGENITQQEQVPKLVLHTFAENAIKHGIMSRTEGGILKISVIREKDHLVLSIEDNGIGRKKAEGHSLSTGKGLKLTGEFYDILNQINKKPIRHLIIDLYDNNNEPAGTRVEVWVPVD